MGAQQIAEIHTNVKPKDWVFDTIADRVAAELGPVLTRFQARHDTEKLLINELDLRTGSEAALKAIAAEYGLAPFPAGAKQDGAAALARRLLDSSAPLGEQRFTYLASGLSVMKTAITEALGVRRIVNLVAPFCWVSPQSVLRVALLLAQPPGQARVVAWARSWCLSERMYLHRGFCTRDTTKLKIAKASDAAGGSAEAILDHIRSVLADKVFHDGHKSAAKVAARIKALAQRGVPVFLLLPAHAVDATVLTETQARWPELCVFLFGEDEQEIRSGFPGVTFLDPPLTPDQEETARTGWGDCMEVADPTADLETEAAYL